MDLAFGASSADPRPRDVKLDSQTLAVVSETVAGLDAWLEGMRQVGGYGGPVVHWWDDCLEYTGPGLDWRYEGVIIGYLNLWAASGEECWLAKAKKGGDDLVAGQLPSGNYRNSCFEQNPNTGGTPHEAACDLALLRLILALRSVNDEDWQKYYQTAVLNLKAYFVQELWDETAQCFRDDPQVPSFVPNKAATLAEALFALTKVTREAEWAERYALPTLNSVLIHQMRGGELDGAICQNSFGARKIEKFFPFYIARCIPALIEAYAWTGDERFADAVHRAADFILRWRYADGSFPQVVYPARRVNRYPQWVAGVGDILRALDMASVIGMEYDRRASLGWLLAGRRSDGGFRTAVGFGRVVPLSKGDDPRDNQAVCGWADKAFRYLTSIARPYAP